MQTIANQQLASSGLFYEHDKSIATGNETPLCCGASMMRLSAIVEEGPGRNLGVWLILPPDDVPAFGATMAGRANPPVRKVQA